MAFYEFTETSTSMAGIGHKAQALLECRNVRAAAHPINHAADHLSEVAGIILSLNDERAQRTDGRMIPNSAWPRPHVMAAWTQNALLPMPVWPFDQAGPALASQRVPSRALGSWSG